MFGKLIALIIFAIAIYTMYRIYERGKISQELRGNLRRKPTHDEVVAEQTRRDDTRMLESFRKLDEQISKHTVQPEILQEEKVSYKKRVFTPEEKREYAIKQKEKKEKGARYEAYVADHYRSLGYEVIEHGKIMGKRDGGIDLIAKNHQEAIMIQCKNWKAGSKYTISHSAISAFVGNVQMFIAKNPEYEKYDIKRIFTVSEPILDKSALAQVNNNREMVRYEHIPLP